MLQPVNREKHIWILRGAKIMNEVNKTLFIPLYGKSQVSKQGIILNDPMAEKSGKLNHFRFTANLNQNG